MMKLCNLEMLLSGKKQLMMRLTKGGIDYFDTYAPVARITTIRLLLALAVIHNLVIYQMDVKTAFLNGDLDKEVYMKQTKGFVMPVDKTKKFLSSRFSMKDMGEADVILGIKIKRENKGIVITQSHYIEKILKKFNREDCSLVCTPMDPVKKLKPNTVGRLIRFTSNPGRQHWQAITRVFKYLNAKSLKATQRDLIICMYVVPTGRVLVPTGRYVVPTGRVVVLTGRYVVPTGRVVVPTGRVVVPTGRYVVPTGRVVVPTGRYVLTIGRVVVPTGRVVIPTGRVISPGAAVVAVPSSDRHHNGGLAADSPYSSNKSNQSITKLNISQYGRCNHHAWKSKHEIGGCISPTAVVVANLPSTARHGWKSRRCDCCGSVNSGVVVYGSWRLWAATKVAAGCHGDDQGGGLGMVRGSVVLEVV
nr:zinc finger, CCHC-type [Tanacetum cinerariifolium]